MEKSELVSVISELNSKELKEVRNDFLEYIEKLKKSNFEEYKKIMDENFNEDYGVIFGPKSFVGKVYKYDSGVIGVDRNGISEEIIIDETNYNHLTATLEIGKKLIDDFVDTNPLITGYDAGILLSKLGILLLQLEGDCIIVYQPDEMTNIQNEKLKNELEPRKDFDINYVGEIKKLHK